MTAFPRDSHPSSPLPCLPVYKATVGLALTLVVQDLKNAEHELYWPNPKREGAMKKPWTWAKVAVAE